MGRVGTYSGSKQSPSSVNKENSEKPRPKQTDQTNAPIRNIPTCDYKNQIVSRKRRGKAANMKTSTVVRKCEMRNKVD